MTPSTINKDGNQANEQSEEIRRKRLERFGPVEANQATTQNADEKDS